MSKTKSVGCYGGPVPERPDPWREISAYDESLSLVLAQVIGIVEEISTYPWIGDAPLISPGYKAGVAFALMVAMLIWRPSGLFRGRVF